MRLWEIGLIAINFGLLGWLLFAPQTIRRYAAPALAAAFGAVAIQLVAEGARWQMIPAYASPVVLTAALLMTKRARRERTRPGLTRRAALLTVYMTASVTLPALMPIFTFEAPTGPYAVGTTLYHWTDAEREETYTLEQDDRRELMVQIWYPAEPDARLAPVPYLRDVPEITAGLEKALSIPAFALSHLGQVQTHAQPDAKLSGAEERYPVLIFSHGLTGFRNQNTFQVEELASHGYIVIGIDHTFDAAATVFPDGRAALIRFANLSGFADLDNHIKLWTDDVSFVLDQVEQLNRSDTDGRFTGRIDTARIGMFGHSYGGAAAVQMLMQDSRVKAAINMDGTLYGQTASASGIGKPLLIMNADKSVDKAQYDLLLDKAIAQSGKTREEYEASWNETVRRRERALAGGGMSLIIPDTDHMSYTDFHLFSPLLRSRGEDPRQVHRIVNGFSLAFFDQYVKQSGSALAELAAQYPEVNFTVNDE